MNTSNVNYGALPNQYAYSGASYPPSPPEMSFPSNYSLCIENCQPNDTKCYDNCNKLYNNN